MIEKGGMIGRESIRCQRQGRWWEQEVGQGRAGAQEKEKTWSAQAGIIYPTRWGIWGLRAFGKDESRTRSEDQGYTETRWREEKGTFSSDQ